MSLFGKKKLPEEIYLKQKDAFKYYMNKIINKEHFLEKDKTRISMAKKFTKYSTRIKDIIEMTSKKQDSSQTIDIIKLLFHEQLQDEFFEILHEIKSNIDDFVGNNFCIFQAIINFYNTSDESNPKFTAVDKTRIPEVKMAIEAYQTDGKFLKSCLQNVSNTYAMHSTQNSFIKELLDSQISFLSGFTCEIYPLLIQKVIHEHNATTSSEMLQLIQHLCSRSKFREALVVDYHLIYKTHLQHLLGTEHDIMIRVEGLKIVRDLLNPIKIDSFREQFANDSDNLIQILKNLQERNSKLILLETLKIFEAFLDTLITEKSVLRLFFKNKDTLNNIMSFCRVQMDSTLDADNIDFNFLLEKISDYAYEQEKMHTQIIE